jgi:trehalose synthase-fused probable maltokinase
VDQLLQPPGRAALEAILPAYILPRRWFGAKARRIASARVIEAIPLATGTGTAYLALIGLAYADGGGDTSVLPLALAAGAPAERLLADVPHAVLARTDGGAAGVLYDASFDPAFCAALLELIAAGRVVVGEAGELRARPTSAFERLRGDPAALLAPKVVTTEQSNTSIIYGDRLIMKLFRKIEPGLNPDPEIGRFLTEHGFRHSPPAAGAIEYHGRAGAPAGLAFLQGFVPNQGDAWNYTLRTIARSFERLRAAGGVPAAPADPDAPWASEFVGDYRAAAELLGRRTAELHLALASDAHDPDFTPEPFDEAFRHALDDSMRQRAERTFRTLRAKLADLPESSRVSAQQVLDREAEIIGRMRGVLGGPIDALRTRVHGDYHLGQVLYTGDDFSIIDFEGEPARPLAERRVKSSPIQDIAGMLRSFHYAPYAVLLNPEVLRLDAGSRLSFGATDVPGLEPWARLWHHAVSAAFLRSYLATAGTAPFLPRSPDERQGLLDTFLLDKAVYELAYELNNRPAWVRIPVEGILQLLS